MWARAARAEARRDSFATETTWYVLEMLGIEKYSETKATLLGAKLRKYASITKGRIRTDLLTAARVQSLALDHARQALNILGQDDAYLSSPGLYYYAEHLSTEFDGFILPSPSTNQLRGDELARRAVRVISLTLGAAAAFMLAALAAAFYRAKRPMLYCSTATLLMTSLGLVLFWGI